MREFPCSCFLRHSVDGRCRHLAQRTKQLPPVPTFHLPRLSRSLARITAVCWLLPGAGWLACSILRLKSKSVFGTGINRKPSVN